MNQVSSFTISKDKEFIIYGASFIGRELYNALSKQGYNVILFLDKDAKKFNNVLGKPVLVPESRFINNKQKESAVVIVAVTNYKEHSYIAKYLNKIGYKNVIYRMAENSNDEKYFEEMNRVHECLVAGKEIKNMSILKYAYIDKIESFDEVYRKNLGDNKCIAFIPSELLFYIKDKRIISVYQAISLLPFYNFIEGKESGEFLNNYFSENSVDQDWARFMEVERGYYKHFSFIRDFDVKKNELLPKVFWDEKSHFFVVEKESLRYVIYNIAKNYTKIQCVLNEEDYEKWINRNKIKPCIDIINEGNLSFVYTPISHPAFFDFPSKREECGKTRLMTICEYLYKKNIDIKDKKILDAGSYVCYFSQHMHRMGANVTAVECDKISYRLADSLNKLLYCGEIKQLNCGVQEIDRSIKYDITLLLTVLYWHLNTELATDIIKTIDSVTKNILFWESGNEIEYEKNWIMEHSSFNYYEKISNTFGGGKFRELGVFSRK